MPSIGADDVSPDLRCYLKKAKVGVIGGDIIVELLQRWCFKEIRVLEEKTEVYQTNIDPFYKKSHVGMYPTYTPFNNTRIVTHPLPTTVSEFKSKLKGVDVVIGCRPGKKAAIAAREIGIPYITGDLITTVLPDGIPIEELEIQPLKTPNVSLVNMIRSIQSFEAVKLFSGMGTLIFPPYALKVDILNMEIKRVRLKTRSIHRG